MRVLRLRAAGVLLAGVVLGCAATVGVALARDSSQVAQRPTAEHSAAPATVPVTRQVLVDSEVVSGTLSWADTAQVFASDGVVTAMAVADTTEIAPGQVVAEINDRPVVALHMRFGPWRDLTTGDSGADVRELHTALAELGRYDGDPAAPVGAATFAALAAVDPRLGADPLPAAALVAVDATGSTLEAPGVAVGTRLGDLTMSVRRHSDQIAVEDGGMAEQYARPGQQIELFDSSGASVWLGTISQVGVDASRTLLTVAGTQPLPEELGTASVVVASTQDEVLAVPRVAVVPQPDGSSSVQLAEASDDPGAGEDEGTVTVTTGLCAQDLCEVRPDTPSSLEPGLLVRVP